MDLTKQKLKSTSSQTNREKVLLKQRVRVHRKSPYLGLTPLVIGEFLYQGEDSRVHVETTLGVFILYFGSFFWVYREKTPLKKLQSWSQLRWIVNIKTVVTLAPEHEAQCRNEGDVCVDKVPIQTHHVPCGGIAGLSTDNNNGCQRHLLQLDLFCQTCIF